MSVIIHALIVVHNHLADKRAELISSPKTNTQLLKALILRIFFALFSLDDSAQKSVNRMIQRLAHQLLPSSATNMPMLTILSFNLTSCGAVFYESMGQFGGHKRDILIDPVAQASNSQEDAENSLALHKWDFAPFKNLTASTC
ncbi:MAG: hypothetical protein ACJATW_002224 [Glaciecola sp.]